MPESQVMPETSGVDINALKSRLSSISGTRRAQLPPVVQKILADVPELLAELERLKTMLAVSNRAASDMIDLIIPKGIELD